MASSRDGAGRVIVTFPLHLVRGIILSHAPWRSSRSSPETSPEETTRDSSPAVAQVPTRIELAAPPELEEATEAFETISLDELGSAALMDRVDRKFLVPTELLPDLLSACSGLYRLLSVGGRRMSRYSTRYYDTPDLALYQAHHAGRAPRFKVRVRTYLDSGLRFLEVKRRNNKGRTMKVRVPLSSSADPMAQLTREGYFGLQELPRDLGEEVVVEYTRLTLVHKTAPERITLDLMLTFKHDGLIRAYPEVAIAEVKQDRSGHSYFVDIMRELKVREGTVSKYCMGVVSLEPKAKKNHFKAIHARLEKMGSPISLPSSPG